MNSEFETLIYDAEDHYLQSQDLNQFKQHLDTLAQRLETYELLRDQEIAIFQPIADQLEATFPAEDPQNLTRALKHGLSVLRYCTMAMLLANQEYLQRRLLEWLPGQVQAHQLESVESYMFQAIREQLLELLTTRQITFFHPYLDQAQQTLLGEKKPDNVMAMH